MSGFFNELKRRNVTRVGVMYLVFGWVLIQLSDIIFPMFSIPEWGGRLIVIMLAMGFPLALIFAWVFELTPEGVKLEKNIDRTQSVTHTTARKLDVITIILLVFALVVLGASNVANHNGEARGDKEAPVESGTGADPAPQSIAVLPFVNMSDDPANEYFSDGLAEELLNDLARIDALRVAGRTSSFAFKGKDQDLRVIGELLNVTSILEGSVRKAGNRVRITAQLINVNDGYHLWSGTYERELDDIFAIQQEISSAIVKALKITLSVDEQVDANDKGTTNAEAYSNYLRGLFFWNRRTVPDFMKAEEYFGQALDLDPNYARAHAMLGMTYVLIPDYDGGTKADWYPKAQQAIDTALRLNPDQAETYVARGHLRGDWRHDWLGAEQDYKRAVELNPRYATARQWYGNLLQLLRRNDESLEQFRIAIELDSMSPIILNNYGYALYLNGQFEEALAVTRQSMEVLPDAPFNYEQMAFILVDLERWDEAEDAFRKSAELNGRNPEIYVRFVAAMEDKALTPQAVETIMTDTEWPHDVFDQPWFLIKLGVYEEAISLIEQYYDEDVSGMGFINVSYFDPVRDDPRIQAILERMNLAGI